MRILVKASGRKNDLAYHAPCVESTLYTILTCVSSFSPPWKRHYVVVVFHVALQERLLTEGLCASTVSAFELVVIPHYYQFLGCHFPCGEIIHVEEKVK